MPDMVKLPMVMHEKDVYNAIGNTGAHQSRVFALSKVEGIDKALDFAYGDNCLQQDLLSQSKEQQLQEGTALASQAILTIRNDKAAAINEHALQRLPAQEEVLRSANKIADSNGYAAAHLLYTEEYCIRTAVQDG